VSIPISYGCDHHCTYCIVRLRRGTQRSRPPDDILTEARAAVESGAREVMLLGQNVDAYGKDLGPAGRADLGGLLTAVSGIDGLLRLRFLTSHPADMSTGLIENVARLKAVCPHFELPVQSGDDLVLRMMGRGYTAAQYSALVALIREKVPGCSIATDVIVGFPGESRQQFQATLDLVLGLRFDSVHIAKYSPRPGTPGARMLDDVPAEEKESRRKQLEQVQTRISQEINAAYVGRTVLVLIEERHRGRWKGRTVTNRLVFFEDSDDCRRGQLVGVEIVRSGPWALRGLLKR
jgi:tRNA-2-methylthio-N6-dimethylallyladenosine synthase